MLLGNFKMANIKQMIQPSGHTVSKQGRKNQPDLGQDISSTFEQYFLIVILF